MTSDGGGWTLVYKNLSSSGLTSSNTSSQGSVSCLSHTTANCSAKLADGAINTLAGTGVSDAIAYRLTSPNISQKYYAPNVCVYQHTAHNDTSCMRYTHTYTSSSSPTYIQCQYWGGSGGGLNFWYQCGGNSSYTNVAITHRGYAENAGMTTNSSGANSGSSDTSYGNSTYMWVR
jgi:hypothetical protein